MGAWIYATQAVGSNWVYAAQEAAPSAAPVLTFPNAAATGQTTAAGEVITNTASGTLRALISGNPTELAATVKSFGVPSTVITAGLQNVAFSGLAPSTPYYVHFVHSNGGNDSAVASSGPFTTFAPVSITVDVFRDWTNPDPLALITVEHTVVMRLDRTVVLSLPNQSTNAQGRLVLTGPGLVGGVPYVVACWNADCSINGIDTFVAS
jgi:hypothetical protein